MLTNFINKKVLTILVSLCPILGQAADIPVSVPANGFASGAAGGGLTLTGNYTGPAKPKLQISWNITQTGSGYHYVYTIGYGSGVITTQTPQINTFVLGVSPTLTSGNLSSSVTNLSQSIAALQTFTASQSLDLQALPSSIYGMGFVFTPSAGDQTVSFDSTRAPIWGSAYASNIVVNLAGPATDPNSAFIGNATSNPPGLGTTSGGVSGGGPQSYLFGGAGYNTNFGTTPTTLTTNFTGWIPIPGVVVPVPEPSTYLVLGTLMLGIVFLKLNKASRQTS